MKNEYWDVPTVIIDEEWTMIIDNELEDEKTGEPAQGVEFSDSFKGHIIGKAFDKSLNRIGLVSVQEISKKWIQRWKAC